MWAVGRLSGRCNTAPMLDDGDCSGPPPTGPVEAHWRGSRPRWRRRRRVLDVCCGAGPLAERALVRPVAGRRRDGRGPARHPGCSPPPRTADSNQRSGRHRTAARAPPASRSRQVFAELRRVLRPEGHSWCWFRPAGPLRTGAAAGVGVGRRASAVAAPFRARSSRAGCSRRPTSRRSATTGSRSHCRYPTATGRGSSSTSSRWPACGHRPARRGPHQGPERPDPVGRTWACPALSAAQADRPPLTARQGTADSVR